MLVARSGHAAAVGRDRSVSHRLVAAADSPTLSAGDVASSTLPRASASRSWLARGTGSVWLAAVRRRDSQQAEWDVASILALPAALPAWAIAVAFAYSSPTARRRVALLQTAQLLVFTTCSASSGRYPRLRRTSMA